MVTPPILIAGPLIASLKVVVPAVPLPLFVLMTLIAPSPPVPNSLNVWGIVTLTAVFAGIPTSTSLSMLSMS